MSAPVPRMGPITRFLVHTFTSEKSGKLSRARRRTEYGLLEGYVSVIVNVLLFLVKGVVAWMTGSIAVMADAVHTLSDSLTSVVVIASSYFARKPPDKEHPYGHGRIEPIATVVIAVLLGVAAFEFGKGAVVQILNPGPLEFSWLAIAVMAGTMLIKEWLSRFARVLGRISGNTSLEADFWHHRSDVLSTALVVVAMVLAGLGWSIVDGIAGLGVALFLLKVAWDIAQMAIHPLVGQAPSQEEVSAVRHQALSIPGVRGVHDVVIHQYGDVRFVSLHVETSDALTAAELHDITQQVETRVGQGAHGSVCVHPDPVNDRHPYYQQLVCLVSQHVQQDSDLDSFHDLRIVGKGERFNAVLDVRPDDGCDDHRPALERLTQAVQSQFPKAGVVAEVDPLYTY